MRTPTDSWTSPFVYEAGTAAFTRTHTHHHRSRPTKDSPPRPRSVRAIMVQFAKIAALAAACIAPAAAHPGEKHDHAEVEREIAAREHWAHAGKRSLDACSNKESARRFAAHNAARRARIALELRAKAGIITRA